MKVVVFGAGGMLGSALMREFENWGSVESHGFLHKECDILDPDALKTVRREMNPNLVINAAGAPNRNELVNSLGPWYIARAFECKVWHISTDCVFDSSKKDVHKTIDAPQPDSEYGISKLLGEQIAPHVSNIRTSFIGHEHGLLRWLLDQPAGSTVNGWDQAFWSGSTVNEVARVLVELARNREVLPNICHLAVSYAHVVTKYDLLAKLIRFYGLDLTLKRDSSVYCNRSLAPTKYLEQIDVALAAEPPYEHATNRCGPVACSAL